MTVKGDCTKDVIVAHRTIIILRYSRKCGKAAVLSLSLLNDYECLQPILATRCFIYLATENIDAIGYPPPMLCVPLIPMECRVATT